MDRPFILSWLSIGRQDSCFGPVPQRGDTIKVIHSGTHIQCRDPNVVSVECLIRAQYNRPVSPEEVYKRGFAHE